MSSKKMYEYWICFRTWSLLEAIKLINGFSPDENVPNLEEMTFDLTRFILRCDSILTFEKDEYVGTPYQNLHCIYIYVRDLIPALKAHNINISKDLEESYVKYYGKILNNFQRIPYVKMQETIYSLNIQIEKLKEDVKHKEWLYTEACEEFQEITKNYNISKDYINQSKEAQDENNSASDWEKDLVRAMRLSFESFQEGSPLNTEYHRSRWRELCHEEGYVGEMPRRRAFEAFRRALPAEYKFDNPGKKT